MELARQINAEIVSLDSMALYRGLDIGTAKPTPQQLAEVPHHLIDVLQPHQQYSLAQYVEAAKQCIQQIKGRGREVLLVGGTPLYLKGLLRGIFSGPAADWEFRRQLQRQAGSTSRSGCTAGWRRSIRSLPRACTRTTCGG